MTDRSNLTRVVESISSVPRGVDGANLMAAILEGLREGPDPEGVLSRALEAAYERAAGDPSKRSYYGSTSPVGVAVEGRSLRQVQHEARKAIDLGARPRSVIGFLVNGLTGRDFGPVEYAAADAMWAAYDDTVRSMPATPVPVRGRDIYKTSACKESRHARCRTGWRAPSGWMPCTCTCHRPTETEVP